MVKVTKRSKTYFCQHTRFRRIHMKPAPKCSLFNSLSSDMPHEIVSSSFIGLFVCIYVYVCMYATNFSQTTRPNCMKFSRMICHHPRTNRLDFGSNQVKGQGQEKVKNC